MKKSLIVLAATLLMGNMVYAGGGFDISIGPKVGYQTAKLSYQKEDIKTSFTDNLTIGLFGRVEIGGLYVQPEVLWFNSTNAFNMSIDATQTQVNTTEIPNGLEFTMTRKAMNIQVPVLLGYKLSITNLIGIRAQVGPTANFIFPEKTEVATVTVNEQVPEEIQNAEFDTKSIAWGLQMGVGVDIWRLSLDVNYNKGITKIFGDDIINNTEWGQYIDTNNIDESKQNMFIVTLGIRLF